MASQTTNYDLQKRGASINELLSVGVPMSQIYSNLAAPAIAGAAGGALGAGAGSMGLGGLATGASGAALGGISPIALSEMGAAGAAGGAAAGGGGGLMALMAAHPIMTILGGLALGAGATSLFGGKGQSGGPPAAASIPNNPWDPSKGVSVPVGYNPLTAGMAEQDFSNKEWVPMSEAMPSDAQTVKKYAEGGTVGSPWPQGSGIIGDRYPVKSNLAPQMPWMPQGTYTPPPRQTPQPYIETNRFPAIDYDKVSKTNTSSNYSNNKDSHHESHKTRSSSSGRDRYSKFSDWRNKGDKYSWFDRWKNANNEQNTPDPTPAPAPSTPGAPWVFHDGGVVPAAVPQNVPMPQSSFGGGGGLAGLQSKGGGGRAQRELSSNGNIRMNSMPGFDMNRAISGVQGALGQQMQQPNQNPLGVPVDTNFAPNTPEQNAATIAQRNQQQWPINDTGSFGTAEDKAYAINNRDTNYMGPRSQPGPVIQPGPDVGPINYGMGQENKRGNSPFGRYGGMGIRSGMFGENQDSRQFGFQRMGLGRRFAEGGMVPAPLQKDMGENRGDIDTIMPPQTGGPSNKELIAMAVGAIKGKEPEAQMILAMFVKRFGQEALQDLVGRIRNSDAPDTAGRVISGPGGPKDDMIPAVIDGQEPARLSAGEYVVPTDAVNKNGGPSGVEKKLGLG